MSMRENYEYGILISVGGLTLLAIETFEPEKSSQFIENWINQIKQKAEEINSDLLLESIDLADGVRLELSPRLFDKMLAQKIFEK